MLFCLSLFIVVCLKIGREKENKQIQRDIVLLCPSYYSLLLSLFLLFVVVVSFCFSVGSSAFALSISLSLSLSLSLSVLSLSIQISLYNIIWLDGWMDGFPCCFLCSLPNLQLQVGPCQAAGRPLGEFLSNPCRGTLYALVLWARFSLGPSDFGSSWCSFLWLPYCFSLKRRPRHCSLDCSTQPYIRVAHLFQDSHGGR